MKEQQCLKCKKNHRLYYLVKKNNTLAMFMLCPILKEDKQMFVVWVPLVEKLPIPYYLSGSEEYEKLKGSVQADGSYSETEREIIDRWRKAKLVPSMMSKEQLELIKNYVKVNPRW